MHGIIEHTYRTGCVSPRGIPNALADNIDRKTKEPAESQRILRRERGFAIIVANDGKEEKYGEECRNGKG